METAARKRGMSTKNDAVRASLMGKTGKVISRDASDNTVKLRFGDPLQDTGTWFPGEALEKADSSSDSDGGGGRAPNKPPSVNGTSPATPQQPVAVVEDPNQPPLKPQYHMYLSQRASNLRAPDKQRAAILRALLTDPDILILHHPWEKFSPKEAMGIAKFLRKWVDDGGHPLILPHRRRQRTVFFAAVEDPASIARNFADVELWVPRTDKNTGSGYSRARRVPFPPLRSASGNEAVI